MTPAVPTDVDTGRPTAVVRRIGWLHFLNDLTLDFLTPLLPAGVGAAWIGLMEGLADGVGQVLKLITGRASDASGRRAGWVRLGYGVNAMARPLAGIGMLLLWPWWVLTCRVADRVGKGLRGSATDALVSDWTSDGERARVFGRLRMMDHLGATIGALAAALVAASIPTAQLGWCVAALAPVALVVVWLGRGLRDAPAETPAPGTRARPGWWPEQAAPRRALEAIAIAGLASRLSPLLVLVTVAGLPTPEAEGAWPLWLVCIGWAVFGVVQSLGALATGPLSDRFGARTVLRAGWLLLAVACALLGSAAGACQIAGGVLIGIVSGALDGVEKAWISTLVPRDRRGTAFGALALAGATAGVIGNGACGLWLAAHGTAMFLVLAGAAIVGAVWTLLRTTSSSGTRD